MLCALYNGHVHVMNFENQQTVKDFEVRICGNYLLRLSRVNLIYFQVCDLPVRCAKFVPRKNWIITGSDDMQVSIEIFLFCSVPF